MRPLLLLVLAVAPLAGDPAAPPPPPPPPPPKDVSALLAPILARHGIPGMAGAIVGRDRLLAIGAAGVRAAGGDAKATTKDLWHLGSCTKAMTATLCGMLVEDGTLRFDGTLGKAFEDLAAMDPAWKAVTLEQLLVQRSGVPTDLTFDGLWGRLWSHRGTPVEQRRTLAEGVLARPPVHAPGGRFLYANANFALAGAMAERAAGKPCETLLRERLFGPLGMDSAGFGAPGSADAVDQPRGHTAEGKPVTPGPGSDNPASMAPAGTVHCSVADWGKFVAFHLRAGEGGDALLKPETFRKLQRPPAGPGEPYAMGWAVGERPWAGRKGKPGPILTHSGTNTMWYCVAWLAPERGFAVLVCCNRGGDEAAKGCDEAAGALIGFREKCDDE